MTDIQLSNRQMTLLGEIRGGHVELDLNTGCFLMDGYFYEGIDADLRVITDLGLAVRTREGRSTLPDPDVLPFVLTSLGEQVAR